jgi:hypothetical protein
MLAALSDNAADVAVEEEQLRLKTAAVGDRGVFAQGIEHPIVRKWFNGGHKARAVDPRYYTRTRRISIRSSSGVTTTNA